MIKNWKKLFLNYFDLNNDGKVNWWEYLIPIAIILSLEVVAELIEDEGARLTYCDHTIDTVCDALRQEDPNIAFIIKKIDSVRQSLGTLDARLQEMERLLSG